MDCKDLMVGDWVSYKDDPPYIVRGTSICKVVTIDNGIDHRNVMDDVINPIPLTEDILVKNGFRIQKTHDNGKWLWVTDNSWLAYSERHNYWYYEDIKVTYVHQLQHLLGMAGVQKEIEL